MKLRVSDFAGYIDKSDDFKMLGTVSGHVGINVEGSEIANLELILHCKTVSLPHLAS